ncbi:MAG TPA: HAMP domain-containing sensor histidine kinase [Stellaceae bacterium]|nr:HAMP domain-containing sensor histidine kinase [Stellaceae bacterium]
MRRSPASLNRRLLLGAAVFIAAALIVAAIAIAFILERFITGQIDGRLDTQIVFLSSLLRSAGDGTIALAGNADGPPFDRPQRGWYWEIIGPRNALLSHALGDTSFDVPRFHLPPRGDRPAPADGPGPGGQTLHFRIQPTTVGGLPIVIVATAPRDAVTAPLHAAMRTLALSLIVLGIALVVAIVLQVRLGLRPLERLRDAIAEVRDGRRDTVPEAQPLEILPLVAEVNGLLAQNAANLERARAHVANLAHGLKTPLATLALALAERGRDPSGELHALAGVIERRIRHHLSRARAAALGGPVRAKTPVAARLADVGVVLAKIYADKHIALVANAARDLAVACEQQDFDEMAGNLLDNAFKWARGQVRIRADRDPGRQVAIVIEDDGPGLQPHQIRQVLRPGERIDETAPGFGFGLPITRELAELYGGDLDFGASDLGGLKVTLRLPRAA